MNEKSKCPHCGAKMEGRWERLTPGLVKVLVKFKQEVINRQRNLINPNKLANLTHTEKANFQKLRFHALVAKVRVEGEHPAGMWLLTRRGSQFLLGQISVPRRVFVFRNDVKEHDTDLAFVGQILRSGLPTFDGFYDFEYLPVAGAEKHGSFFVNHPPNERGR